MAYDFILFEVNDGIATITMNRPKQMNSFNIEIMDEMADAAYKCNNDDSIRVVIITGAGSIFSAGDDIKIMDFAREKSGEEVGDIIETKFYPRLIKSIMSAPKPYIACVNGGCYGAAGEVALACDYVIASDKASFGQFYINVALIGNTYLLPRHVGVKKAMELIWTGRLIPADEAYQLGMVNKLVAAEALVEETQKFAKRLAKGPTVAYGLAKEAIYKGLTMDINEGLHLMCQTQGVLMKTRDHLEGVEAFINKRKPVFSGN